MNQGQLKPGPSSEYVQSTLAPIPDNILEFAHFQLHETQCIDDYREFSGIEHHFPWRHSGTWSKVDGARSDASCSLDVKGSIRH